MLPFCYQNSYSVSWINNVFPDFVVWVSITSENSSEKNYSPLATFLVNGYYLILERNIHSFHQYKFVDLDIMFHAHFLPCRQNRTLPSSVLVNSKSTNLFCFCKFTPLDMEPEVHSEFPFFGSNRTGGHWLTFQKMNSTTLLCIASLLEQLKFGIQYFVRW